MALVVPNDRFLRVQTARRYFLDRRFKAAFTDRTDDVAAAEEVAVDGLAAVYGGVVEFGGAGGVGR